MKKNYFMIFKPIFKKAEKFDIAYSDGECIEEIIEKGRIGIKPSEKCGLDGYSYVFTFFNNGNFAQYSWWGAPDEKWCAFNEIIDIVFKNMKSNNGYERKVY